MSNTYYPDDTDHTMNIDDRDFHNVDMLLKIQREIEQEDKDKAEQSYAQRLLDSEAYDEGVHAREAEKKVENQIEEGQHAMGGVAVLAAGSSGTASVDSFGALATPQWFTHEVDGVKAQQRMFNLADERGDEVYVGSDVIGAKKGTKKYTSSKKHVHLAAVLLKRSVEKSPCSLYEMSREDTPCKCFLDVEWEESECSGYSRLDSVYDALFSKFMVSHLLLFILYSLHRETSCFFSFFHSTCIESFVSSDQTLSACRTSLGSSRTQLFWTDPGP
jgi:hypothetical protein